MKYNFVGVVSNVKHAGLLFKLAEKFNTPLPVTLTINDYDLIVNIEQPMTGTNSVSGTYTFDIKQLISVDLFDNTHTIIITGYCEYVGRNSKKQFMHKQLCIRYKMGSVYEFEHLLKDMEEYIPCVSRIRAVQQRDRG